MGVQVTILRFPITEAALPFRVLLSRRNRRKSPIPSPHSGSPQDHLVTEAKGTHAGTRWHSPQLPSSTAGRWRKAGTSHSPPRKYYVCNYTPACQTHSSHTHLHGRCIYTWEENRQKYEMVTKSQKWMQKKEVQRELNTTYLFFSFTIQDYTLRN